MKTADFEKAVLKVKDHCQRLCLHLMGEPLTHPHFNDILNVCQAHQIQVELTTNGILLPKMKKILLYGPSADCLLQINISLQSFLDSQNKLVGSTYWKNILIFCSECIQNRPKCYLNLRLWNLEGNGNLEHHEDIFLDLENYFQCTINRAIDLGHIKSKRIKERLYFHFDSRFSWPRLTGPILNTQGRCHGLSGHVGIHSTGEVVPCCLDDQKVMVLGNIFHQDLTEIINTDRAIKVRNGFQNNELVEDLCQRCSYIQRFS